MPGLELSIGRLAAALLLAANYLVEPTGAVAGEKVHVGRRVPAALQVPLDQIDHAGWNALLARFVDERGLVAYRAWHGDAAARAELDAYLAELSRGDPARPARREGVLAFWINAYNAVTVWGILREYPTTSIRNHTPRLYGYHIWNDLLLAVGGGEYSLSQIEHEQLRPLGEPRIHFAIVCASLGCPPLAQAAYLPEQLDEQLSANARRFFAEPTKFRAEPAAKTLYLSWIWSYYAGDFGATPAARLAAVAPYFPDDASRRLAADPAVKIKILPYDWDLNDRTGVEAK